jgi:hypothetical protein
MVAKEQSVNRAVDASWVPRVLTEICRIDRTRETTEGHARLAIGGKFSGIPLSAYVTLKDQDEKGCTTFNTDCALCFDGDDVLVVQLKKDAKGQPSLVLVSLFWKNELPEDLRPGMFQPGLTGISQEAVDKLLSCGIDRRAPLLSIDPFNPV